MSCDLVAIERNLAFYVIDSSWAGWVYALLSKHRHKQSRQGKQEKEF